MADKRSLAFAFLGEDKSLGRTLKGVAGDADHAHRSLSRLGKVAIGAGAIGGAVLLAKKLKDVGDETVGSYTKAAKGAGALQRLIGGSVEDASRLQFAAHEAGVEEESFTKSLRLLEKNLGTATKAQVVKTKATHQEIVTVNRLKDGHIVHVKALKTVTDWTTRTVKVSKDLGFTYKDAHGKLLPMRDVILNVADRFSKMPNGVEKTTLALKLFGRAGTDMIPILNKGRDGVQELMKESDKLGTTMSAKDVKAVKDYTLQQRHLHAAMEGLKITIGRELFPIFTAWSDSLAKNAPKIIVWVKSHLPQFRKEAKKVADFIKDDLEPAFADGVDAMVKNGEKLDKMAGPFFHYIGDHKDMFTQIAKDAVVLGAVLKASSFIKGLGLLRSGGRLGAPALGTGGGVATAAKPVPVYVTNKGFGPGTKVPPIVTAGKGAAAAATARTLAGVVAGPVGIAAALTAGDTVQLPGFSKDKNSFAKTFQTKHAGTEWSDAQQDAMRAALGFKKGQTHAANNAAPLDKQAAINYLLKYGGGSAPARTWLNQLGFRVPAQGGVVPRTQDDLDDPRRARAYTAGLATEARSKAADQKALVQAITQGTSRAGNTTIHMNVYGLTLDQAIKEGERRARVAALGNRVPGAGRRGEAGS